MRATLARRFRRIDRARDRGEYRGSRCVGRRTDTTPMATGEIQDRSRGHRRRLSAQVWPAARGERAAVGGDPQGGDGYGGGHDRHDRSHGDDEQAPIQFGNATTNTPDDPERIDSVKWTGSSGVPTANLAASGGRACGDGLEWWGESYGATTGEPPYLVVGGSTGTWGSPAPDEVQITSESSSDAACGETHIPVTTSYTFYDSGAAANEIRVERRVAFNQFPYANTAQQGLRVYAPRVPLASFSQVLYPDASGNVVASGVCDDCAPLDSSHWGGGWFADNNPSDNSGVLVARDPSDQPGAQLELDHDSISAANNTAIDCHSQAGGGPRRSTRSSTCASTTPPAGP
jgi:hypothetical protein